ncbi:MAG: hypothetical protein ACE5HN_11495 [Nitrospiria bacterium]
MKPTIKGVICLIIILLAGTGIRMNSASADEMEHEHMMRPKKEESGPPPGAKEVRIDLSGPFCHRHPDEITDALMKMSGIKAVEAFSGRRYIVVQYMVEHIAPGEMAETLDKLKGSGWHCKAVLPK